MAASYAKQVESAGLTWVSTTGGPHILVPESSCRHWRGVPMDYSDDEGDYGRACAVDGYIGLIDVGRVPALVFGDHPGMTTYLRSRRTLVRWMGADSEAELLGVAIDALDSRTVPWDEELLWDVHEPVILFDSSCAHEHIAAEDHLLIDLAPGSYTVRAGYVDRPDASAILVQFTPTADRQSE
ncbi:Imm21 family immunity protein [Nonomuraea sp. NPDC049725]|uniref:Imm21 family immunity protein n=1 Tax=Nonomuraea sp. NPDC049725 TaxID=3154508 RepID=UPI0034132E66